LRAAGHHTGRYTSPHLVHLEERIAVAGASVTAALLDGALDTVRTAVEELLDAGSLEVHPTFFEIITAAAFVVFARAGVDVAVIEVGLGGRFDATNVVDPVVAAITSIALDHEQHLGASLEAIAFEKAGIVKPGVPVVVGELPEEARGTVRRVCQERGARLHDTAVECVVARARQNGRTILRLTTPRRVYLPIVLALRGDHQAQNAAVAVRLLELMDERGVQLSEGAIAAGLAGARWPARLDLIPVGGGREVLVDGAHNPAGTAALEAYVRSEWPDGLPLVFGAMGDKHAADMLRPLATIAQPLILTTAPGPRAADAESLAAVARSIGVYDPIVCPRIPQALDAGWERAPRIAAAGSLYLAGEILRLLADQ
jgi:dihydrofolate synthase/folylpolyglutamate synthase